eukprot:scaffold638_cov168-Amphora_coffeaeformis.AAC.25
MAWKSRSKAEVLGVRMASTRVQRKFETRHSWKSIDHDLRYSPPIDRSKKTLWTVFLHKNEYPAVFQKCGQKANRDPAKAKEIVWRFLCSAMPLCYEAGAYRSSLRSRLVMLQKQR